jgi:transcriptional regulator with XRE-family HTH domain
MTNENNNQKNEPDLFNNDLFGTSPHPAQKNIPGETPEPPEFKPEPETVSELEPPVVFEPTPVTEKDAERIEPDEKPAEPKVEVKNNPDESPVPVPEEIKEEVIEEVTEEEQKDVTQKDIEEEPENEASTPDQEEKIETPEKSGGLKKLFRKKEKVDDYAYFGILLRDTREAAEMSIEDVSRKTKIRKSYLEALEHENFSQLPSKVYIRAYIRTLCELYNMESSVANEINLTLQDEENIHLGEEVYTSIMTSNDDDDEIHMRHRSFPVTAVVGVVLFLALIIGGWLIFRSYQSSPPPAPNGQNTKFDNAKLNNFEQDQLIKMSELPIPE